MEEQQGNFPPRNIEINENIYSYKDALINDFFTYRYKHRRQCGLVIKIKKEKLLKFYKDKKANIEYKITSSIKTHQCKNNKKQEDINTENNNIKILNDKKDF